MRKMWIALLVCSLGCQKLEKCDVSVCEDDSVVGLSNPANWSWSEFVDNLPAKLVFSQLNGSAINFDITVYDTQMVKHNCSDCPGYFVYKPYNGKFVVYDGGSIQLKFELSSKLSQQDEDEVYIESDVYREPRLGGNLVLNAYPEPSSPPHHDSLLLGNKYFYNVYEFNSQNTEGGALYFTKKEGIVAFKVHQSDDLRIKI